MTISEPHDLAGLFHALSSDARVAALVYGVVAPHVCNMSQMGLVLRHAEIVAPGRQPTTARLQDADRELAEAGIAYAPGRGGSGLRASPHWAPWLTIEAHRRGVLDKIATAHTHVQPRLAFLADAGRKNAMALRCRTVAGRLAQLSADAAKPEAWGFLAEPGAAGLLGTLPETCRDQALAGCLMRVADAALPPEPIIDACRELGSDPSAFAADIAFIRILQGRLDEVAAVFDTLPPGLRESKHARTGRAGALALVAMLRGDDGEARGYIETAVAEERAGTRKRNVFPASPAFALSLLSLVRDDSPPGRALLAPLLRTAGKQEAEPRIVRYVARAAEVRKGVRIAPMKHGEATLAAMLQGLECCWLGQFRQYAERAPSLALAGYMSRARDAGFEWALAECLAIAGRPELRMAEGAPARRRRARRRRPRSTRASAPGR